MSSHYLTVPTVAENSAKRARLVPPVSERIMIYVRQETEVSFHLFFIFYHPCNIIFSATLHIFPTYYIFSPPVYILQDVYTPLHLVPPTVQGLIGAIENKYKINATNIRFLYRKNKDGIVAKVDDDMLRHYCNEDVFLMQVLEASFSNHLMYLT